METYFIADFLEGKGPVLPCSEPQPFFPDPFGEAECHTVNYNQNGCGSYGVSDIAEYLLHILSGW
jgi:hypothetical protein